MEGGEGTKSYDGEKALSSVNHSILSDVLRAVFYVLHPSVREWSIILLRFNGKLKYSTASLAVINFIFQFFQCTL